MSCFQKCALALLGSIFGAIVLRWIFYVLGITSIAGIIPIMGFVAIVWGITVAVMLMKCAKGCR